MSSSYVLESCKQMARYCDKTLFNWILKNPLWVNNMCCTVRFQCDFPRSSQQKGVQLWIILTDHSNPLCIFTNSHSFAPQLVLVSYWVLNNSVKFLRNRNVLHNFEAWLLFAPNAADQQDCLNGNREIPLNWNSKQIHYTKNLKRRVIVIAFWI